jgi:PST family polysaccharide transporter
MVLAITSFADLFRDLGLSSAAIQKKNLTRDQQSNLFWINVATGSLLTLIVAAGSPLVGWFYKKPELVPVTVALSFSFLIASLGTQHGAMMVRMMQFGRRAMATLTGAVVGLIVSVILAWSGSAYWALVWGNLGGAACTTTLLFILSPFWPGKMSRGSGVRGMLGFGANITAFNFVNYFSRNLDNILIGKYWGSDALGIYSKAYSLLMLPLKTIRGPINSVAYPAMCKLQNHPESFRDYYRKTVNLLAWLSMPLTALLWLVAPDLIEVMLGKEWSSVAPIFAWLAVASFIQPASSFIGSVQMSLGHGRRYLVCGIFNAAVLVTGFLIGIHWGAKGVAISYVISSYAAILPCYHMALKDSPVRTVDFLQACRTPATVSILAAGICYSIPFISVSEIAAVRLAVTGSVFSLVILGIVFSIPSNRGEILRVFAYLNQALRNRAQVKA